MKKKLFDPTRKTTVVIREELSEMMIQYLNNVFAFLKSNLNHEPKNLHIQEHALQQVRICFEYKGKQIDIWMNHIWTKLRCSVKIDEDTYQRYDSQTPNALLKKLKKHFTDCTNCPFIKGN